MVVFHFKTCLSPGTLGKAPDAGTPQGPTKGRQEVEEPPPSPLPQPGSLVPQLCAAASLTHCSWPTSARLPPRGQPAPLQLRSTARTNASFSKKDASHQAPEASTTFWQSMALTATSRRARPPGAEEFSASTSSKRQLLQQPRS